VSEIRTREDSSRPRLRGCARRAPGGDVSLDPDTQLEELAVGHVPIEQGVHRGGSGIGRHSARDEVRQNSQRYRQRAGITARIPLVHAPQLPDGESGVERARSRDEFRRLHFGAERGVRAAQLRRE
jgi:hypothetical protein